MTREIKFRAWDKKKTEWFRVENLHLPKQAFCGLGIISGNIPKPSDIEWQQYTGLKDKNGVEIYEGDILDDKINNFKFKIDWQGSGFVCLFPNSFNSYINKRDFTDIQSMKIIGNIYENKDLLTRY